MKTKQVKVIIPENTSKFSAEVEFGCERRGSGRGAKMLLLGVTNVTIDMTEEVAQLADITYEEDDPRYTREE